jgi:nickel-dependent lactate racemase
MTEAELGDQLGAAILVGSIVQHDAWSDDLHIERGVTARGTPIRINKLVPTFDAILAVGFVAPSHLLGFSGGKELVVPGIVHHTTVAANRRWLFHPDARIGFMHGNPASEDAEEAAAEAPLRWVTHAVADAAGGFAQVISGRPRRAHLAACRAARALYEVPACKADIVVASAGGAPHDLDLALAAEALNSAAEIVNPGGAVILVAECPDGWGPEPCFGEWLCGRSPREVIEQAPSSAASCLGVHHAYLAAGLVERKGAAVILVTSPDLAASVQGSFVAACTDLGEAMDLAQAHAGADASVAVLRHARRLILSPA